VKGGRALRRAKEKANVKLRKQREKEAVVYY